MSKATQQPQQPAETPVHGVQLGVSISTISLLVSGKYKFSAEE